MLVISWWSIWVDVSHRIRDFRIKHNQHNRPSSGRWSNNYLKQPLLFFKLVFVVCLEWNPKHSKVQRRTNSNGQQPTATKRITQNDNKMEKKKLWRKMWKMRRKTHTHTPTHTHTHNLTELMIYSGTYSIYIYLNSIPSYSIIWLDCRYNNRHCICPLCYCTFVCECVRNMHTHILACCAIYGYVDLHGLTVRSVIL